ncbi:MAG: hypothetical protein HW390_3419 [Candidatus Brocadiaceae bacterium]|nr:hypothetical protein [Candidatus Brocadiaceae bacterium]
MIDHSIEEYDGKPLLFIFIPESKSRPVRVRGKSIEDSYIRSGAQTRKMDQREIRKVLISSQPTRYEELTAYTSSSLTEILQRLDYVRVFDMLKLPVPKNDVAIAEFLFSQKILSRSNEFYNITNLGAAICAKELQKPLQRLRPKPEVLYILCSQFSWRRGRDSNPRRCLALTVFKTVAIDHSATPPAFSSAWQGGRDSNPQPTVLETATLPIELPP